MKGFTLVELLISIAIFTVITSVAVFNNAQFNGSVLLTNLVYEIALSIREAQQYGISVKESSSSNFNSGYGVHFDMSNPTQYVLFEDTPSGTQHVFDVSDVTLQTYTISKGDKISKVCLDGSKPCSATTVDISFERPNPDAYIYSSSGSHSQAEVCVTSPQGMIRKITVESTGQISVGSDTSGICS